MNYPRAFLVVNPKFRALYRVPYYRKVRNQFEKLNAIAKNYELRDDNERKFLDVKLINLNKHTLPLYKRLNAKNKEIFAD